MSVKHFLAFLTDSTGKSLTLENGVPVTKAIPDALDNTPIGYENNMVQYTRSYEYHGLIKTFITGLKFTFDGAKILRDYFYKKGWEVVMFFIWLKLNQNFTAGMKHEGWYKGEPDLATFSDEADGVEINITEGGFYKELQANKNVPYNIPFDADKVTLEVDGIELDETSNFETLEYQYTFDDRWKILGLIFLNAEGSSSGVTQYTVFPQKSGQGNPFDFSTNTNYFFRTENALDAHFKFTLRFRVQIFGFGGTGAIEIYLQTQTRSYPLLNSNYSDGWYSFDFDFTWSLLAGETVFLAAHVGTVNLDKFTLQTEGFKVSYQTRRPTTIIDCMRVYDLGNKLVKQVSNNVSSLTSPILQNNQNLLCTSGDAIRGIVGAEMKTKFQDWYQSVDSVKCLGLKIVNNNPVITSRYDNYDSGTTIANLGIGREFGLKVAKEYCYDQVEVGYGPQDTEDVNGRYSFNNRFVWKAPVTRFKNIYNAVSVYYSDPYVIELVRINLANKTTTDGSTDNDMFFFDAEKVHADYVGQVDIQAGPPSTIIFNAIGMNLVYGTRFKISVGNNIGTFTTVYALEVGATTQVGVVETVTNENLASATVEFMHYRLRRPAFTTLTGVPTTSVFNVLLSPGWILREHYRWLRSSFDHMDSKFLEFQTTDKNADLVSALGGITVTEKANILIGSMGAKAFLPYFLTDEFQTPYNLLPLMQANSDGVFVWETEGEVILEGFPVEIKTNDETLETQEYKMLSSPNNDLTKLINNR